MAKEVRLDLSNDEKLGLQEGLNVQSFRRDLTEELVQRERSIKYNNEVEKLQEKMEAGNKSVEESQESLGYDINKAEMKPMFNRVLIKPFKQNPFQKMVVKNGLIVDTGGYNPHTQFNQQTGRYEEQDQFIVTGCVIEVGPETKYLKEGDVVYYRKDTAIPVPFFKQGLVSLAESQIIAVVNEGLQDRFNSIK